MGDDGRAPLSRRIPGATNMPKAQVRGAPPRLPDHVLERLRAEVSAAREKTAELPSAKLAEQTDVAQQRPTNVIRLERPKNMDGLQRPKNVDTPQRPKNVDGRPPRQVAWHVVPDSPYSPIADSGDTTEPIPVVRSAKPSIAISTDRDELNGPAGGVDCQPGQAARQKNVGLPRRSRRRDYASQVATASPPATATPPGAASPGGAASPPGAASPATTHSAPGTPTPPATVSLPDKRSANGRTDSAGIAGGRELAGVSLRARARPRGRWPISLAAASRPTPDREPTMLQALFAETDTLEEIIASAKTQARGRPAGLEWRYRMVVLIVTALVVLGVLVFLASH